jgi:uncharacterized phage protein (TIGR02220 family)
MGIKRIVDTQFWNDDKVIDYFSPEDKLFMLYLMTNPHTTQLGIYSINKKVMAFELGYSNDTIDVLLDRFENKYKIIKYSKKTNEIAIKNFLKYSIVKGGKPVEDLLIKELNQVKDEDLIEFVYKNIINYSNLNESVKNILNNYNENEIHNDNDNDNDNDVSYHDSYNDSYHDSCEEIINHLNTRTGQHYKTTTKKTRDLIKARLKEKFTVNDFKVVIDKMCVEWMNTDMQKYLRPETLFGTKFEGYLNREVSNKKDFQWEYLKGMYNEETNE